MHIANHMLWLNCGLIGTVSSYASLKLKSTRSGDPNLLTGAMNSHLGVGDLNTMDCAL